jgi:hypothetical protein
VQGAVTVNVTGYEGNASGLKYEWSISDALKYLLTRPYLKYKVLLKDLRVQLSESSKSCSDEK